MAALPVEGRPLKRRWQGINASVPCIHHAQTQWLRADPPE
jgi:hypothetical protein